MLRVRFDGKVEIDESERQMIILALAVLSLQRPGWNQCLQDLATKFGDNDEYNRFKTYNEDQSGQKQE